MERTRLEYYFSENKGDIPEELSGYQSILIPSYEMNLNHATNEWELISDEIDGGWMGDQLDSFKHVKAGDFVINRSKVSKGAIVEVPKDGFVGKGFLVIRPNDKASSKYFGLVFQSHAFRQESEATGRPMSGGNFYSSFTALASIKVPALTIEEQEKVATFFIAKLEVADKIIKAERKALDTVRLLKSSLIHQASGFDPNAKYFKQALASELPKAAIIEAQPITKAQTGSSLHP